MYLKQTCEKSYLVVKIKVDSLLDDQQQIFIISHGEKTIVAHALLLKSARVLVP
jgi:hypothetical protein